MQTKAEIIEETLDGLTVERCYQLAKIKLTVKVTYEAEQRTAREIFSRINKALTVADEQAMFNEIKKLEKEFVK